MNGTADVNVHIMTPTCQILDYRTVPPYCAAKEGCSAWPWLALGQAKL